MNVSETVLTRDIALLTLIRPDDDNNSLLRIHSQIFIQVAVALVIALVVKVYIVQVANMVLSRHWIEAFGDLLKLYLMALSGGHQDQLNETVDVAASWGETAYGAFIRPQIVSKLRFVSKRSWC